MNKITTPLCRLLGYGFRQICLAATLLTRLGQASGGPEVFPARDGPMLLTEAKLRFRMQGLRGFSLLVLASRLMVVLLLVLMPLLVLGRLAADFLERHSVEIRRQPGWREASGFGQCCPSRDPGCGNDRGRHALRWRGFAALLAAMER